MLINLEARREGVKALIGKCVRIEALGENKPNERTDLYVPLPEYGISLWLDGDETEMNRAGDDLATAAVYVSTNYDGVHRLRLAIANWFKVRANEGGRDQHAKCCVCGLALAGKFIGMGDGTGSKFACPECYWRTKYETLHAETMRRGS